MKLEFRNRWILSFLVLSVKEQISSENFCSFKFESSCEVLCQNLNLSSKDDVEHLSHVMATASKTHKMCSLTFELCAHFELYPNFWEATISRNQVRLFSLKIVNSEIDINRLGLKNLPALRSLTLKNTSTSYLGLDQFIRVPSLRKLRVRKNRNLKFCSKGLVSVLRLNFLQIRNLNLSRSETETFFRNLSFGANSTTLKTIDWSFNNFGKFSSDFVRHFPSLENLNLKNSRVYEFERGTFDRKPLRRLRIDNNEIKDLPERDFRPIFESGTNVTLTGNELLCDCKMAWLKEFASRRNGAGFENVTCDSNEKSPFLVTDMCPAHGNSALECPDLEERVQQAKKLSKLHETPRKFILTKEEPQFLQITISENVDIEKAFFMFINFRNRSFPSHKCVKPQGREITVHVDPEVDYMLCLIDKSIDCLAMRSKPLVENQTWLTRKSILLSIISIMFLVVFALFSGALILYLSVRKNPSLIRGSKRVIEVKRHDKTQILIMPRGYESAAETEAALVPTCGPVRPFRPSNSCDTLSTVSYVSANQPTQLEILTYRLNRLREIFRSSNDLPPRVPSFPVQVPSHQRIPPNVDLLFEYEWYTITTTTTTTTTTEV